MNYLLNFLSFILNEEVDPKVGTVTQNKNIFVYGTLALKDKQRELGLTYKNIIEYDYIKGYKLWEITDNGDVYLQARKEEGIISGSILIDCNLDECLNVLDEWEGEQYTREIITTEINKTECIMYIFNSNNSKKHDNVANEFNETKSRLKRAHDYIKIKCEKSKEKTKRMNDN